MVTSTRSPVTPESLMLEADLSNYIPDAQEMVRAAITGSPLANRDLERVAQTIINRAIEDLTNHVAYSVTAARLLSFISEREEAKAREVRKAWGEPDPPFVLRSVMAYMQEILGEKESFKTMEQGWDKWFSFLSCILHFFQFNAASPVLSTSIPTMLTNQVWQALRELTEWKPKKMNQDRIRLQVHLIRSFMANAGERLNRIDGKNMDVYTNVLRDKFGDPDLSDENLLGALMEILELRASWHLVKPQ